MKKLIAFLLVLVGLLQYRLWLGDGGIRELQELDSRIEHLKQEGERRQERNAALEADVKDLKEGSDAIEERARQELGLVKEGETFFQILEQNASESPPPLPEPPAAKPAPIPSAKPKPKPVARSQAQPLAERRSKPPEKRGSATTKTKAQPAAKPKPKPPAKSKAAPKPAAISGDDD